MRVEHYIAELLYRYNCVVVPEFGAFLANTVSAQINQKEHTFYPPSKQLSFNQQLSQNDGLLASYMADAQQQSYDALLETLSETVKAWQAQLADGQALVLEGIGKLWMGEEQKIQFLPEDGHNYLATAFGLASYNAAPVTREKLKEQVVQLEEAVPFTITPESRENGNKRTWLKYAAIFMLCLATGASAYQLQQQQKANAFAVEQQAEQEVNRQIQEATFFSGNPIALPALTLKVAKKEAGPKHHIIAGAFRFKANADKKVAALKEQGYRASYLGLNKNGLHQVAFDSFTDGQEALAYLRTIKNTVSADAWMLSPQ